MSNPGPAIGDVTPGLPKITLTALNPKENYQLWLEGLAKNGAIVKSNIVAFTTRADDEFNGKSYYNHIRATELTNVLCCRNTEGVPESNGTAGC